MIKKKTGKEGWIGFDFDGTLATHEPGSGNHEPGDPIPGTVKLLKAYLREGYEVRIVTARVWCPDDNRWSFERANEVKQQRLLIRKWCKEHIGQELKVTCEKDYEMVRLYDDRAVQVQRNTGKIAEDLNES